MAADEVSRALEAWRAAIREADAQTPGTDRRAVLDEKTERARVAYQHTINADTQPGRGYGTRSRRARDGRTR
jgi:hypothetical protein